MCAHIKNHTLLKRRAKTNFPHDICNEGDRLGPAHFPLTSPFEGIETSTS